MADADVSSSDTRSSRRLLTDACFEMTFACVAFTCVSVAFSERSSPSSEWSTLILDVALSRRRFGPNSRVDGALPARLASLRVASARASAQSLLLSALTLNRPLPDGKASRRMLPLILSGAASLCAAFARSSSLSIEKARDGAPSVFATRCLTEPPTRAKSYPSSNGILADIGKGGGASLNANVQ